MGGTAPLKTGGTLGLLAAGDTDAQNKTAAFDYFRVTPDAGGVKPAPNDEFDGSGHRRLPLGQDPRLELQPRQAGRRQARGSTTFDADISGADNGPIENLHPPDAAGGRLGGRDEDDGAARRRLAAGGLHALQRRRPLRQVRRRGRQRPGRREGPPRRAALRERRRRSPGPGGQDIAPPASATDTWWLRLTKKGNTYTGAISADGTTWVQAPGSVTVALNNPAIGLMAIGPRQAAPIDVDFEYFRVGAADTEAPATTHTLLRRVDG